MNDAECFETLEAAKARALEINKERQCRVWVINVPGSKPFAVSTDIADALIAAVRKQSA